MNELDGLIEEGKGYTFENNSSNDISKPSLGYQVWILEVEGYIGENYENDDTPKRLLSNFNMIYLNGFGKDSFDKNQSFILAAIKSCKRITPKINKEISSAKTSVMTESNEHNNVSDKSTVFIVHGHNGELKEKVARTLQNLGLVPVILHEKACEGDTLIEKFEKRANVGFAIILLTNDDEGKDKLFRDLKPRARQNVILEWGYFIGKLSRKNVIALYEDCVELPSDLNGLGYIQMDSGEGWKIAIVRELRSAGYKINADNLI